MDTRTHEASDAPVDPLDEPAYVAFVYAAWAGATLLSPTIGLAVLVAATAVLTISAVRTEDPCLTRSFLTDFGLILLFCCAAMALGVLTVRAVTQVPALLVGAGCLVGAAGLVTWALRPDRPDHDRPTPSIWEPAGFHAPS